jgi:hypothetical protein
MFAKAIPKDSIVARIRHRKAIVYIALWTVPVDVPTNATKGYGERGGSYGFG